MLSMKEQQALAKVLEVYNTIITEGMPQGSRDGMMAAAELTKAWAMFAKEVEKNN